MSPRIQSGFDDPIISERAFLNKIFRSDERFPEVNRVGDPRYDNECDERKVGRFREDTEKRSVTTDSKIISMYQGKEPPIPAFLVAGPRKRLFFEADKVNGLIVTTGGSAPGLNCVIHSIVKRHQATYGLDRKHEVYGVKDSFLGMCDLDRYMVPLKYSDTEKWIERGGSMLGMRRYHDLSRKDLATAVLSQLYKHKIDILYVIGGDGSLTTAHEIFKIRTADKEKGLGRDVGIVGIPKTMDNDVMWVSESFGFKTAVEKATEIINTLNSEAETSRRICLIELFGAESGYVAAHAALASGHVDLVLVPEDFIGLSTKQCQAVLDSYLDYLINKVSDDEEPHAIVVLAEGTAKILKEKKVTIRTKREAKRPERIKDDGERGLLLQLKEHLKAQLLKDKRGNEISVFFNRPRHYVRASPANAQDKIYCEQLGALAVDSALAGYTDFMLSQWLTSYVLVPLELVADRHKRIPTSTLFWKHVLNSTGQRIIECQADRQDGSEM